MKTDHVLITPEKAGHMIDISKTKQRTPAKSHVNYLARQMKEGKWLFNGEPIIVGKSGHVIDGQHRLLAVIASGISVNFLIVHGIEDSVFPTIDCGMKRSHGNILQIAGVSNGNAIASMAGVVLKYEQCAGKQALGGSQKYSSQELLSEYEKYADHYNAACERVRGCRSIIPSSVAGGVCVIASKYSCASEDSIPFFWRKLTDGEGLAKGDPILVLRNKLVEIASSRAKPHRNTLTVYTIKSWNAFVSEKSISVLRAIDSEICPQIL